MVVLGADLHKRSHTIVVIDPSGRQLAEKTIAATDAGHLELRRWAAQWPERTWGLEDCRHLSRRLDAELVRAGEAVVRVSPKLMAGARRSGRELGKSDPIDALAVARAVLREPDLPVATLDGPDRELRLLVDHREDLVGERTRHEQRLRWFLVELAIAEPAPRSLGRALAQTTLAAALAGRAEPVARFARDLLDRIIELSSAIRALEHEIESLVRSHAPTLLALAGCGALTAAKIIGEAAGISRFRSKEAFARHNGTAPVPVWSGNVVRHRLNRGGNRQLNVALHRIAITQIRLAGPGQAYLDHRLASGNSRTEAIRALRRRLSDEVFRRLVLDEHRPQAQTALTAAAA